MRGWRRGMDDQALGKGRKGEWMKCMDDDRWWMKCKWREKKKGCCEWVV